MKAKDLLAMTTKKELLKAMKEGAENLEIMATCFPNPNTRKALATEALNMKDTIKDHRKNPKKYHVCDLFDKYVDSMARAKASVHGDLVEFDEYDMRIVKRYKQGMLTCYEQSRMTCKHHFDYLTA